MSATAKGRVHWGALDGAIIELRARYPKWSTEGGVAARKPKRGARWLHLTALTERAICEAIGRSPSLVERRMRELLDGMKIPESLVAIWSDDRLLIYRGPYDVSYRHVVYRPRASLATGRTELAALVLGGGE